ncbi:MAG: endonuclease [Candidatus Marinimicrobia bacterium]|nr:endonuclease [Candidatus Neomarinimicrobiota bacterium]
MDSRTFRKAFAFPGLITYIVLAVCSGILNAAPVNTVIGPGLTGQELLDYIIANYKTSTTLGYDSGARDTLYRYIDLRSGNQLSCVYSGFTITLDTMADASADAYNKGINCEHSWPQSVGAESEPRRSDMHHLYPVKDNVNSSRGNDPYMEITDANADVWFRNDVSQTAMPSSNLEEWAEKENGTPTGFEPCHASKGNVARSSFYFFAMYHAEADTNFWNLEKDVLYQWHYTDPVDQDEYDRTYRIAHYQDDKPNPFVLDSTLARRIWFTDGGSSTPPSDSPTTLSAGDVVIIGVNCDESDDFAFVPLVDLGAGTTINFTDNGWLSANAFRTGEGILTYTVPSYQSAGTVIVYSSNSANFSSSGSFGLSTSGDQLIAYQGTVTSPTMLFAVNICGSAVWQADAASSNTSALPLGLTNGANCVAVIEKDNVKYTGSITSGKDAILAAVSNKDNWVGDDAARYDFTMLSDYSLPVTLTSFTARPSGNAVALAWTTESEIENLGFIVQRRQETGNRRQEAGDGRQETGEWNQVAIYVTDEALQGHGSTTEAHEYACTDAAVQPGATYTYRLADVDYSGSVTWHKEVKVKVEAEDGQTPMKFGLQPAYPNPFNPSVTLSYTLIDDGQTNLKVYNLRGQLVETLISTYALKGAYSINWQPQNLSAGMYIVRMQSGNHTSMQKVVFVK